MYKKIYLCVYKHIKSATDAVQTLNGVLHINKKLFNENIILMFIFLQY